MRSEIRVGRKDGPTQHLEGSRTASTVFHPLGLEGARPMHASMRAHKLECVFIICCDRSEMID